MDGSRSRNLTCFVAYGKLRVGAERLSRQWGNVFTQTTALKFIIFAAISCGVSGEDQQFPIPARIDELLSLTPPSLRYTRITIPDEQNAFLIWQKATQIMIEPDSDVVSKAFDATSLSEYGNPLESKEDELLLKWLIKNRAAIDLLDDGARRGRCQFPENSESGNMGLDLYKLRHLARMKISVGRQLAARGKSEAAAAQFVDVIRIGEITSHGDGNLSSYLMGGALQLIGHGNLRWLATQKNAQPGALELALRGLADTPCREDGQIEVLKKDFYTTIIKEGFLTRTSRKDTFIDWFKDRMKLYGVDDKDTMPIIIATLKHAEVKDVLRFVAGYYERLLTIAGQPWIKRKNGIDTELDALFTKSSTDIATTLSPFEIKTENGFKLTDSGSQKVPELLSHLDNFTGKMLTIWAIGELSVETKWPFRVHVSREATRIIIAIRIYESKRGAPPEQLTALVEEKILNALPLDPYSDEPFRYSKERGIIWSVAEDAEDNGGDGDPKLHLIGKDFVWTIPQFSSPLK